MKIFQAHFGKGKNRVTIDGRDFVAGSVSISNNGTVFVDGQQIGDTLVGPVHIVLHGDVETLETVSGSVEVTGSAGRVSTTSGDVTCGEVGGNVSTMSGDVKCGGVGGNVSTMSGDVYAGR